VRERAYTARPVTSVAARLPRPAVRRRLRAVPIALWILLAVAAVHGTAWAFVTAPLNGPDETSHVAYVQSLVENGRGPERGSGSGSYSTEVSIAGEELYLFPIRGQPGGRPVWDRAEEVERNLARLGDDGRSNTTGPNPAAVNPPLYYAYAAVAWQLSPDRSVLGRITAVRLATVLLMVLAVLLAWLAAAEVFARAWPRYVATGLVALHPKLGHTAGQVNPDLLLVVMATGFLAAALRLVQRGPTAGRLAALGLTAAGGVLTHPRGLYLLPAALVTLAIVAVRERPSRAVALKAGAAVGAVLLTGFAGAYLYSRGHSGGAAFGGNAPAASSFNLREFGSYLWQFYFPKYGFFTSTFGPPGGYGYRQFFIQTFFASYSHFEINFSTLVYDRLQIAAFLGLVGLYTAVVVRRREVLRRWAPVLVAVATFGGMLMQLHATSYASLRDGGIDIVITGRYLLPAIALYGIAAAFTVGSLPRRVAGPAGGVLLGAALVLCLGALGMSFGRFHG
jgi:Dolichyl-phosphate-mannose-protein mannosyltransferase